jgi:hypothetical protein
MSNITASGSFKYTNKNKKKNQHERRTFLWFFFTKSRPFWHLYRKFSTLVWSQGAHPGSYRSYVLELRMKYIAQCWNLQLAGCVRANARVEYTIKKIIKGWNIDECLEAQYSKHNIVCSNKKVRVLLCCKVH